MTRGSWDAQVMLGVVQDWHSLCAAGFGSCSAHTLVVDFQSFPPVHLHWEFHLPHARLV